jgi:Rrf2 family protein
MYVSARCDYALRALVTLAAESRPMTADELARHQDLPVKYLESILLDLRRGGLLVNQRGLNGGYRFGRSPHEVTPADVMRLLDGPLAEVRGLRPEATSYNDAAASLQHLWIALRASLRLVLEGVTIAQLARAELPPELARLVADPDAWVRH